MKKMARKSTLKNVKTKEVDLAPKTTTKKRKRLTGFQKKTSPLFGQIRRDKKQDEIPKPGPKKGQGKMSDDERKAAKQQQKEALRLRKQLKATLKRRKAEEKAAAAEWRKVKRKLPKQVVEGVEEMQRKKLLAVFTANLDIWLDKFGPASETRLERAKSEIKFMYKYPDKVTVWRP